MKHKEDVLQQVIHPLQSSLMPRLYCRLNLWIIILFLECQAFVPGSRLMDTRASQSSAQSRLGGLGIDYAATKHTTTSILSKTGGVSESVLIGDDVWTAYEATMWTVLSTSNAIKNGKADDIEAIREFLFTKEWLDPRVLSGNIKIQEDILKQRHAFLERYPLTEVQYDLARRALSYLGDACAKRRLAEPVVVAWQKMKESGMMPREKCVTTYMYALAADADADWSQTLSELFTYHNLFCTPDEKVFTLRIKTLMKQNRVTEAESVLASIPRQEGPQSRRLRTYAPLLDYYCERDDASSLLRLFRQMRESSGVYLDDETYARVLGTLAKYGHFSVNAPAIAEAELYGFKASSGPDLLDELAKEMAEDVLEVSLMSAKHIANDFSTGFGSTPIAPGADIPEVSEDICHGKLTLGRVDIDKDSASCPATGARLRLLSLDEQQRQHVHDQLLEMARLNHLEFAKKGNEKQNDEKENLGHKELSKFSTWLDSRQGEQFTAIVDGANVAYYGHPELRFSQVKLIVDKLRAMGENPLVVLPEKYSFPTFWLARSGRTQTLSDRDQDVIASLQKQGNIYITPTRCLDDYYWMLASVSNQTKAKNSRQRIHSADSQSGRLSGLRPLLVTNDKMRDHKLSLLSPREFRRWCSCHIVNYDLPPFSNNEWEEERQVEFVLADVFSREIQGNNHGNGRGMVWHIPVPEWEEPSRLCLWINQ